MKSPLSIWRETAEKSFKTINEDNFVKENGIYDKIIIDCAFREDLSLKENPDSDGGCDSFDPSLTTNGMCYTFNGKKTSDIWKSSEMIKTFSNLFQSQYKHNYTFGGSRTVQGILRMNRAILSVCRLQVVVSKKKEDIFQLESICSDYDFDTAVGPELRFLNWAVYQGGWVGGGSGVSSSESS